MLTFVELSRVEGKPDTPTKRPNVIASGMNTVTCLIERKKAQLVVIAHDVDPIEVKIKSLVIYSSVCVCNNLASAFKLVMYMPALCRKMDVPYCIIKGKARLGRLVHRKTSTCIAFTDVNK